MSEIQKPHYGIGSLVFHNLMGRGRVIGYEQQNYVIQFKGGEVRRVSFTFEGLSAEQSTGDPELDRVKQAVREVLEDFGWISADLEMNSRWLGGIIKLIPGKEGTQPKEIPIEMFFSKIIGIREKLRVLEQKINNHPALSPEDKLELEGYITRSYGSLTTFNVLFAHKESQFRGQSKED